MGTARDWERLATISKDKGEYFPEFDSRVGTWNNAEETFIRKNVSDKKEVVLDVGCGDGRALFWLKEKGFKRLYGFDISKTCISRAKERLGQSVNLKVGNYKEGLPYKTKFDIVLLMGNTVIAGLDEPAKQLKEIGRILKPRGLLLITCWNGKFLTKKFIDNYYKNLGVLKIKNIDIKNRRLDVGDIHNKWLIESELRKMIHDAGLEIKSLKKVSLGFCVIVSRPDTTQNSK